MAIDDNTSYELTGAQVKDLANKIKAKAADNTFVGSTSAAPGSKGLVPAPQAGDESKVLSGAGTWVNQSGGSTYTAGNGINISANDEISIDTSVVAELSDLPTVNDGTLTIQHNGTTKGTFTANQSSASTVNIETIYADTISPATAVDPITASMIAGGASPETLANGSVVEIVGTTTGDSKNYCIKYADGRMVAVIRKAFSGISFSAWGSCYEHEFSAGWLGNYAVSFKSKPIINVFATCTVACWALTDAGLDNESLTSPPRIELVRPSTISGDIRGAVHCVAYGFWK